jgi:hypothetical protein
MGCKHERDLRTGERGGEFRGWYWQVLGQAGEKASPDALVAAGADAVHYQRLANAPEWVAPWEAAILIMALPPPAG